MAAGDITLSSSKTITVSSLQFVQAVVTTTSIDVYLQESSTLTQHRIHIDNTSCTGVDYTGGVFTDNVARAVTGELTKIFGLVFKAAPITTLMTTLQTDGIVTVAGTVG